MPMTRATSLPRAAASRSSAAAPLPTPRHRQCHRQVKPDGVERGLSGEIISRFETKGLHLIACRMRYASKEILEQHYHHIAYKSFFPQHLAYMQSAPVITMVFEGANAIAAGRYVALEARALTPPPAAASATTATTAATNAESPTPDPTLPTDHTASCWARPTLSRRCRAQCAATFASTSGATSATAATRLKRRGTRSASGSPTIKT